MVINQTSRGGEEEMNECCESIYTVLCTRTLIYSVNAVMVEQFRLKSIFHIAFLNMFWSKNWLSLTGSVVGSQICSCFELRVYIAISLHYITCIFHWFTRSHYCSMALDVQPVIYHNSWLISSHVVVTHRTHLLNNNT